MPGYHPDAVVATGYYRLGLWDDEPADPLQAMFDEYDDIVATTAQAFLGMTMNCARCHDHKIDPIPQKDYYRLTAYFHNIKLGDGRAFDYLTTAPLMGEEELKPYRDTEREVAERTSRESL